MGALVRGVLAAAERRLVAEPAEVRDRVRLVPGRGEDAPARAGGSTPCCATAC
ncbi:MAG TPA: hypothetical protein VHH15_00665 [Actinophytocola sp.]|nr:hypothetical protein [Actinophytocola sp.]